MTGLELFDADHTHAAPRQIEQRRAAHRAKPDHCHVVVPFVPTRLSATSLV